MTPYKENPAAGHPPVSAAESLLQEVFDFDDFLPFQKEIIQSTLSGEDLLVVLPTGSGKSLCFQIPALLREGLTIVISPLIALMKDQIDAMRARELPVECIHSSIPQAESRRVLDDIRARRLKMIYISPERLRDSFFLNALLAGRQRPYLWVVDEAHCITEWGHDFRTDYLHIPDAVKLLSEGAQMVMFTATATPEVRKDILKQMRRKSARIIFGDFDRPNLYLGCRLTASKSDKLKTLSELLRKPGPGIIYTATRRQCEDVNRFLQELGKSSDYYHAGRSAAVRVEVHERFLRNEIEVIAATNAFGMGVDKPDIRFIIHYAHPASIDTYYQEIGRGGRDGGRCDCILLFSRYDRKVQERFIFDSTPAAELVEECFSHVMTNAERSGELSISRRFHESHNIELFEMEKAGILNRRPVMGGTVSIYLSSEFENALDLCTAWQRSVLLDLDRWLNLSGRGYATDVDLSDLRRKFFPDTKVFELEQTLLQMNARGIIAYRPGRRTICYNVRVENVSGELMKRIEESASGRRAFKMRRLEAMTGYAALRSCLRRYLLDMLGDAFPESQCGFCDNCL